MKFLRDLFTEADGTTWDAGRIMWALGFFAFIGLAVMAYAVNKQDFDPVAFGTGLGLVLASGGGMIWMKDKEKP